MNLRQAQRSLAEIISKCEAARILLPEDPLEARAEAIEAIIHSIKDDKVNLSDAQEELQQKFGFELVWKQQLENQEARRQRRRQSKGLISSKDRRLNLELIPEAPPLKQQVDKAPTKSKGGAMTTSKRPASSQVQQTWTTKVAKKAKSVRELIMPEAPVETVEKHPKYMKKKATAGLGGLLEDDDSTGTPDREIAALLDFDGLEEGAEVSSNLSSDEEFAL